MPDIKDKALPESHKTGRDSSWGTSFVLALFMHGFLFAGLFYVVQWTSLSDEVVYAELWAPETAPLAKTPVPEPPKVSEPTPQEEAPAPARHWWGRALMSSRLSARAFLARAC